MSDSNHGIRKAECRELVPDIDLYPAIKHGNKKLDVAVFGLDTYKNNFTYEGKRALFDYLENLEEDTGTEIELDTIALCCEYSEYSNLKEIIEKISNHLRMDFLSMVHICGNLFSHRTQNLLTKK